MTSHITKGLAGIAAARYGFKKLEAGITPAADLQESMINVRMGLMRSWKGAQMLNQELDQVKSTALDISKIAPFSAQDVVGIVRELSNAGLELDNIVGKKGAAWATTALATVANVDPESTASGLVKIGTPYNIQGNQYGELADWMQRTGMHGVAKVPDLVEGMGYVSGDAAKMKIPWKDTLTALSVLGEQGMVGSRGGTELKDFLVRLSTGSHMAKRVLNGVNQVLKVQGRDPVEFWDKNGKLKPLLSIIQNLRQAMKGFTDKQQMEIFNKIFEMRGASAAFALMHEGNGSWEQRTKLMTDAASLEDLTKERLKGLNASVVTLKTTTKNFLATTFEPMLGIATAISDRMNDAVDASRRFVENHPKMTDTALALGAGAIGVAGIYGAKHFLKGTGAGMRVWNGVGGIKGFLKGMGKTGLGIAEGKVVQAATGVQPVFVTNWSDMPTAPGGSPAGTVQTPPLPTAARTHATRAAALAAQASFAGYAAGGTALAGIPISMMISEAMRANGWESRTVNRSDREFEVMGIGVRRGAGIKNDIKIELQVDGSGRVFSRTNDMNTQIATVPRGDFFDGMMKGH